MNNKIILIGPMGAGKTSLGKRLAAQLKWSFFDTDHVLCKQTGVDIPTIFATEGESRFREREHEALSSVLCEPATAVVSCGGGIVLLPENRRLISAQKLVIFLDLSIDEQIKRVEKDKNRPLVQGGHVRQKLEKLREERLALYEGLADIRLDTGNTRFSRLLQDLIQQIKPYL
ncbi:MAG: shikimate kinase [Cardiobacteriaceae bacterium]|nr:shikimate kinase [Cardiobacteriaceae bacterium]